MQYTKEQIEKLKNNPLVQLIAVLNGESVEEAMRHFELVEEDSKCGEMCPDPYAAHKVQPTPGKKSPIVMADSEIRTFVTRMAEITTLVDDLKDAGIDVTKIGERSLYYSFRNIVGYLLSLVLDAELAGSILNLNFAEDPNLLVTKIKSLIKLHQNNE